MNGHPGRVGELTIDEIRTLRTEEAPTVVIARRARVSPSRIKKILHQLGLSYPRGGARPGSGHKPRRTAAPVECW